MRGMLMILSTMVIVVAIYDVGGKELPTGQIVALIIVLFLAILMDVTPQNKKD